MHIFISVLYSFGGIITHFILLYCIIVKNFIFLRLSRFRVVILVVRISTSCLSYGWNLLTVSVETSCTCHAISTWSDLSYLIGPLFPIITDRCAFFLSTNNGCLQVTICTPTAAAKKTLNYECHSSQFMHSVLVYAFELAEFFIVQMNKWRDSR